MSRSYGMSVHIRNANPDKKLAVLEAAEQEWPGFKDWSDHLWNGKGEHVNLPVWESYGESQLCGGEIEEEFATRLTKAIWKAHGGFCSVEVNATYLEDLPSEMFVFEEDAYAEMQAICPLVFDSPAQEGEVSQ